MNNSYETDLRVDNRFCANVDEVWLSEDEILRMIIQAFSVNGLTCEQSTADGGTVTGGTGVLLASGDIGVGMGRGKIEKKVWNPFITYVNALSRWRASVEITKKMELMKTVNDVSYKGYNIRIHKQLYVHNGFSLLGAIVAAPGTIISISVGFPICIIAFFFIGYIPYLITKGIIKWVHKNNKVRKKALSEAIDKAIEYFKEYVQENGI